MAGIDGTDQLHEVLGALGRLLAERGHSYEVIAVGGSGLLLLGLVARPTGDVDIVAIVRDGQYVSADPLPEPLATTAGEIGRLYGLDAKWFNPGPARQIADGFPDGFATRLERFDFGGLVVQAAGRFDQICFKVDAAADFYENNKHEEDLRRLEPTESEALEAGRWASRQRKKRIERDDVVRVLETLGIEDAKAKL